MHPSRPRQSIFMPPLGIALGILIASGVATPGIACADDSPASKSAKKTSEATKWTDLVGKWTAVEFGGEGEVQIDDKLIKLAMGSPLTGIRWTEKVPRENYELTLEARRTDGLDFFCGLTFPVGKDHVSFVLGGWGGGVVGISSIDGYDASENDTTMYQQFKKNQWYKIRVQVTAGAIKCWIDDQIAVDQERSGHSFDIRFEMDETTPLGIAAFQCKSELRKLGIRKLPADEIERAAAELDESSTSKETGNE